LGEKKKEKNLPGPGPKKKKAQGIEGVMGGAVTITVSHNDWGGEELVARGRGRGSQKKKNQRKKAGK